MMTLERAPTRTYHTAIMDSRQWDGFEMRDDDIVIATYPKCGTTWTQRVVDLLVFQNTDTRPIMENSVWLDSRIFAPHEENLVTLAAQTHRRYIKSHLPFDALPIYDGVKYVHVARDGRDAFLSWHNHVRGFTPETKMKVGMIVMNDPDLPKEPPPEAPEDPQLMYQGWIAQAEAEPRTGPGADLSYFDFETTYWRERNRKNMLMVHYADMKADLEGEMRRISDFLEIDTPPERLKALAAAAQFESMKAQGPALLPRIGEHFDLGSERFLNRGVNGRWRDVLTETDLARYAAVVQRKLTPACADWLEKGRLGAGDPTVAAD
jgi:aryl sulfotransferase